MTRIVAPVLLILISFFVAASVAASGPLFQYGTAITYPVSLKDGRGLPPGASHEAIAVFPVASHWSVPVSAGFGTGLDAFQPAPHVQAGAVRKVGDCTRWGATLLYRYRPDWQPGVSSASFLALATGPVLSVTEGVMLILPVGVGYNVDLDAWSGSFTSKLAFTIP